MSDSRAPAYILEYGADCWELDALEPSVIDRLIRKTVIELRDGDLWIDALREEKRGCELLEKCAEQWDEIAHDLENMP